MAKADPILKQLKDTAKEQIQRVGAEARTQARGVASEVRDKLGEQAMTIYLDIRAQAEKSAELAVALARGEKPPAPTKVNNGPADIPAFLLDPVPVNKERIKDTIVKDGFYTVAQICTPDAATACKAIGLE